MSRTLLFRLFFSALLSLSLVFAIVFVFEFILISSKFYYYPNNVYVNEASEPLFVKRDDRYVLGRHVSNIIPQSFRVEKLQNETRIAFLGGSSVNYLGTMDSLRLQLKEEFPSKEFTLVNIGGLSLGTGQLILFLPELLSYDIDILVIYSGHNEFLQVYLDDYYNKKSVSRAVHYLLLSNSRLYQYFTYLSAQFGTKYQQLDEAKGELGLDVKRIVGIDVGSEFDADARDVILHQYKNNLLRMIEMSESAGVQVLLSTPAYNREYVPEDLQDEQEVCVEYHNNRQYLKARDCYEMLLQNNKQPESATNKSNAIVKEVGEITFTDVVDVDNAIVKASVDGIPGYELFNDHCHLNDRGNEILLNEMFRYLSKIIHEDDT